MSGSIDIKSEQGYDIHVGFARQYKSERGYELIAAQCKMARAATGLGVRELAKLAEVSPDTIARLERGEDLRSSTIDAIRTALEAQGIQFLEGGQVATGPGVALEIR